MRSLAHDQAEHQAFDKPSLATRLLWRLVWVLAALLLLAVVTMVSVAMLAPDALSGPCVRVQLVRPEKCSPGLIDDGS